MGTAGIIFGVSIVVFALFAVLVEAEEKRARRFIGGRVRHNLDVRIVRFEEKWAKKWRHVSRYLVQLGWYYSIHSLLSTIMRVLVSIYDRIEHVFERNRTRTKQLRKELKHHLHQASHLTAIADHKEAVALTPEEQLQLREKHLEEDH